MFGKDLDLGVGFFYRVALPGALVGVALLPAFDWLAQLLSVTLPIEIPTALSVALVTGVTLSLLNDAIYQVYEGRLLWPPFLCALGLAAMRRRRNRLYRRLQAAYQKSDHGDYDALSEQLRHGYPASDEGAPLVSAPTRMGNILASYESYPRQRYGMPGAFYWTRLWLAVDKDARDEVDGAWAETDGLMHLAAGLLFAVCTYTPAALAIFISHASGWSWLTALAPLSASHTLLFAGVLLGMSHLAYCLSLDGHLRNGELFKSLFDVHRGKLKDLGPGLPGEREASRHAWAALEHGQS